MLDYLLRRLAGTVPVLLAVSAFVFLFVHLLPGDPARLVAGPDATPQDIAAVRADMASTMPTLLLTVFSIRSAALGDSALVPSGAQPAGYARRRRGTTERSGRPEGRAKWQTGTSGN